MKTDLQPNISVKNPPEIGPTRGIVARTMYKYEYILAPWFTENRSLIADRKIIIVEATARPWNRRSIYSGSGLVMSDERNEDNINTDSLKPLDEAPAWPGESQQLSVLSDLVNI